MWLVFIGINPQFIRAYTAAKELGFKIVYFGLKSSGINSFISSNTDFYFLVNEFSKEVIIKKLRENNCIDKVISFLALKDYLIPLIKHFSDEKVFAVGSLQNIGMKSKKNSAQGPKPRVKH